MGFSIIVTHVVWVLTTVTVLGIVLNTAFDVSSETEETWQREQAAEDERLRARLGTVKQDFDEGTGVATLRIRNDGDVALNASAVTLVADGVVVPFTFTVEGLSGSDRWLPTERAVFTVTGLTIPIQRLVIVTEDGAVRVKVVTAFFYADEATTDVTSPPGSITNAEAFTQDNNGDVANFTEDPTEFPQTRPAAYNDRAFASAPVTGWSKTEVFGIHILAHNPADGSPNANGSLELAKVGPFMGETHLEHTWSQSGWPAGTDAAFTMKYRVTQEQGSGRSITVKLIKPDTSEVFIASTSTWTNATWLFLNGTVDAADLLASGSHTLRIEVTTFGSADEYRFDNIGLAWIAHDDYRFGKQFKVGQVRGGATYDAQVRYRVSSGTEALGLWVEGPPGTWTKEATLSSTTMETASVVLSSDQLLPGNEVHLRLIDEVASPDSVQESWEVDFVRVRSRA